MVFSLIGFALAFLAGVLSKLADIGGLGKNQKWLSSSLLCGFAYGVAFALLLSFGVEFATVFLGIAIAVLFAGKVDSKPHQFAIAGFLVALVFWGFPPQGGFNLGVLAGVVLAGVFDERLHDLVSSSSAKRKSFGAIARFVAEKRLLVELFLIAVGLALTNWIYLAAIVCFDVGYLAVDFVRTMRVKGGTHGKR